MASSGLTKAEEKSLKEALERLNAVNRPAYLGGMERHNLTEAIRAIHYRLNPTPVDRLLDTAERLSKPLEHTFDELARLQAEAVLG